ncbi:GntR family transcriptional regulator [Brevibacterium litoralis]|uniref:GntR family transcriptional regulator n=1 Tax=Brevibacterium litoralis TaxID=3138935 RepID=UPI0032F06A49
MSEVQSRDVSSPEVQLSEVAIEGEGASATMLRLLRGEILSGRQPAGTRLTENGLARKYSVSRIPVRECLKALEAEGLIETRPYAGATVVEPPVDDAADLFAVRIFLEGRMARKAAERAARLDAAGEGDEIVGECSQPWKEIRTEIDEILDEGDVIIATGMVEGLAELNTRFHEAIAELSGSASLAGLLRQIAGKIRWLYALNVTRRGVEAWSEHRRIIDAIDAGDADRAAGLVEAHVSTSRDSYFTHIAGV